MFHFGSVHPRWIFLGRACLCLLVRASQRDKLQYGTILILIHLKKCYLYHFHAWWLMFLSSLMCGTSPSSVAAVLQLHLSLPRHFAELLPDPEHPSDFPAWSWTPSVPEMFMMNADQAHQACYFHPACQWWDFDWNPTLYISLPSMLCLRFPFYVLQWLSVDISGPCVFLKQEFWVTIAASFFPPQVHFSQRIFVSQSTHRLYVENLPKISAQVHLSSRRLNLHSDIYKNNFVLQYVLHVHLRSRYLAGSALPVVFQVRSNYVLLWICCWEKRKI